MEPVRQQWIETADGCRLDADVIGPPAPRTPRGGIVVAHPHPLYGGNRHHPVVEAVTEHAAGSGWLALRFDFRGTGRSSGQHADGIGEVKDMEAALAHLVTLLPEGVPLVSAGYSFGAVMALRARHPRITRRIAIAAPVKAMAVDPPTEPTLLLVPAHDQFTSPEQVQAATAGWPSGTDVVVIEGADHFLNGFTDAVATRAVESLPN